MDKSIKHIMFLVVNFLTAQHSLHRRMKHPTIKLLAFGAVNRAHGLSAVCPEACPAPGRRKLDGSQLIGAQNQSADLNVSARYFLSRQPAAISTEYSIFRIDRNHKIRA